MCNAHREPGRYHAAGVKYIERILERYKQNNFQSVRDVLGDKKLKEEKELTEEEKEILQKIGHAKKELPHQLIEISSVVAPFLSVSLYS